MRRFLIGLFLQLCAGASLAQADNAFSSFLLRLRKIEKVDIHAFGDTIIAPNLADAAFEPYLSPISPQSSGRKDCAWQGGGYIKKGDVDYVAALFDKGGHFQKIVNVMHRERDDVDKKMDAEALKEFLRRQVP